MTLARRRQLCAVPASRPEAAPVPAEERSADIFDLREERRAFADAKAALPPRRPGA
ncbi:MAG: hypothetical protein MUF65_12900 [Rubritepida sp.]|nr:hypothetical protein [Rubritepida sp.]MCU0946252.1 hypothetical protein [Rubritepida sp.]